MMAKPQTTFKNEVAAVLGNRLYIYQEHPGRTYSVAFLWSKEPFSDSDRNNVKEVLGATYTNTWTNGDTNSKHCYGMEFRGVAFDKRFDRKTWNPEQNYIQEDILVFLRSVGRSRLNAYLNGIKNHRSSSMAHQSTAMWNLGLKKGSSGVFVDLGAGESGDRIIARDFGYSATGFDLFPINKRMVKHNIEPLVICDIAEHIPQPDSSVEIAVCQAVIDLIEPQARPGFYKEVWRILKPSARFSILFCNLKNGWGYNQFNECQSMEKVGFRVQRCFGAGYVLVKPVSDSTATISAQETAGGEV
jgi:SAM-dependent methyltransferase